MEKFKDSGHSLISTIFKEKYFLQFFTLLLQLMAAASEVLTLALHLTIET
jgi:hypothetical protein